MAKRKKKAAGGEEVPAWMITFSDLVTLLMTFFVLLVSMASLTDVSKRKVALGSVSGRFGTGAPKLDDLSTENRRVVEPGPLNKVDDLETIKKKVQENPDEDIRFEFNRFIQRVTLDAAALFEPGSDLLTPQGRELLETVRPVIADSAYPLGLAGHTADGRDELGPDYVGYRGDHLDFSWQLSLRRVMAVYRYFVDSGVDPEKLRLEAYGRYHPKFVSESAEGRRFNRRVEITLDKRLDSWKPEVAADVSQLGQENAPRKKDTYNVGDFLFRFDLPEEKK